MIHVQHTDSTNRLAKEKAALGAPSGTVIWAGTQASGRGQYGRVFASPLGGLYCSLILRPVLPLENLPLITLLTGLACRDLLAEQLQLEPMIKWPNDIYLGGRKVGGILCENFLDPVTDPPQATVIIGVGINLNSRLSDFPSELQPIVTTVYEHTGTEVVLKDFLALLVAQILFFVESLPSKCASLLDRWQHHDYLLHRSVEYTNGEVVMHGTGIGLAANGCYRIVDQHGNEQSIVGGQLRPRDI